MSKEIRIEGTRENGLVVTAQAYHLFVEELDGAGKVFVRSDEVGRLIDALCEAKAWQDRLAGRPDQSDIDVQFQAAAETDRQVE